MLYTSLRNIVKCLLTIFVCYNSASQPCFSSSQPYSFMWIFGDTPKWSNSYTDQRTFLIGGIPGTSSRQLTVYTRV